MYNVYRIICKEYNAAYNIHTVSQLMLCQNSDLYKYNKTLTETTQITIYWTSTVKISTKYSV